MRAPVAASPRLTQPGRYRPPATRSRRSVAAATGRGSVVRRHRTSPGRSRTFRTARGATRGRAGAPRRPARSGPLPTSRTAPQARRGGRARLTSSSTAASTPKSLTLPLTDPCPAVVGDRTGIGAQGARSAPIADRSLRRSPRGWRPHAGTTTTGDPGAELAPREIDPRGGQAVQRHAVDRRPLRRRLRRSARPIRRSGPLRRADRLLQPSQSRRGSMRHQLLDQMVSVRVEDAQRLRVAPCGGERAHQRRVGVGAQTGLPSRTRPTRRWHGSVHRTPAARQRGPRSLGDALLQPHLLAPQRFDVLETRVRCAPPQRQRFVQETRVRRTVPLRARIERRARTRSRPPSPNPSRARSPAAVSSPWARRETGAVPKAEHLGLQRGVGRVGQPVAPHGVDERIRGDDLARPRDETCEQRLQGAYGDVANHPGGIDQLDAPNTRTVTGDRSMDQVSRCYPRDRVAPSIRRTRREKDRDARSRPSSVTPETGLAKSGRGGFNNTAAMKHGRTCDQSRGVEVRCGAGRRRGRVSRQWCPRRGEPRRLAGLLAGCPSRPVAPRSSATARRASNAVALAANYIKCDSADVVVAGGVVSITMRVEAWAARPTWTASCSRCTRRSSCR